MISYYSEERLLVYAPTGSVDISTIKSYFAAVAATSAGSATKRLINLDAPDDIALGPTEQEAMRSTPQAGTYPSGAEVLVAFLATKPKAVAVARAVASALSATPHEVRVCTDLDEAADFLGVASELLCAMLSQKSDHSGVSSGVSEYDGITLLA